MVLTWVLPTGLEDVLAASLAGLAGYVALLNLPLKRGEAKAKLQKAAEAFLQVCAVVCAVSGAVECVNGVLGLSGLAECL